MKFVSRDSLVEEITGIKRADIRWINAKQEIYQFDKILTDALNSNNTQKIPIECKDGFVKLMKSILKDAVKIKAAGGIHNYEEAKAFIDAGASALGASAGIAIVEGESK